MYRKVKYRMFTNINGCVIGAAYADALGKSTEFMTKWQINKTYGDKVVLGECVQDNHRDAWDPYDWTDDTDQSILVFQSIIEDPENPEELFAKKLYNWFHHGFPELGDTAGCGVGIPVGWVLTHPDFTSEPFKASYDVWKSTDGVGCEDGAIMRTWAIGCFDMPIESLIQKTIRICQVTHFDPRCVAGCIYVMICVNQFLYHSKDIESVSVYARNEAIKFIETADYLNDPELAYDRTTYVKKFEKYLERGDCDTLDEIHLNNAHSRSSVKNPLACVVYAMRHIKEGYERVIQHIVMQGGDADTNACVAGAVMGSYLGIASIPTDYMKLKNLSWLEKNVLKKMS